MLHCTQPFVKIILYACCVSQAARQGVAVLMAYVQVVLKGVFSIPRQTKGYEPIGLKIGMCKYVPEFSSPVEFGGDQRSGGAPTWW